MDIGVNLQNGAIWVSKQAHQMKPTEIKWSQMKRIRWGSTQFSVHQHSFWARWIAKKTCFSIKLIEAPGKNVFGQASTPTPEYNYWTMGMENISIWIYFYINNISQKIFNKEMIFSSSCKIRSDIDKIIAFYFGKKKSYKSFWNDVNKQPIPKNLKYSNLEIEIGILY